MSNKNNSCTCDCHDPVPEDKFMTELGALIKSHNKDVEFDTSSFVLSDYLVKCLETFGYFAKYRDDVKTAPL